ncbi:MAG: carboxypeptidase regulatory-like domain-containing protein [Myxococcales bacterium]|nr:carboxypeptidase regulatory-like domain-containing protein [Myxococcales bacterium]
MSAPFYGILLLTSVGLFLFWDGALWNAAPAQSHVMRFLVSYSAVMPLAAVLLLISGRLDMPHWLTAVGTVWAIKLLLTAPLYHAFAPGGALDEMGALGTATATTPAPAASPPTSVPSYEPATDAFDSGTIRGQLEGEGAAGAIVYLERPKPGRALRDDTSLSLVVSDAGLESPLLLAQVGDSLTLDNRSKAMANLHASAAHATLFNTAVPPGKTSASLSLDEGGLYQLRSDTSSTIAGALLVVAHPYAVRADDEGKFLLEKVPVGEAKVLALAIGTDGKRRSARADCQVSASGTADLQMKLTVQSNTEERP